MAVTKVVPSAETNREVIVINYSTEIFTWDAPFLIIPAPENKKIARIAVSVWGERDSASADGTVYLYYSTDGSTWTQLGAQSLSSNTYPFMIVGTAEVNADKVYLKVESTVGTAKLYHCTVVLNYT